MSSLHWIPSRHNASAICVSPRGKYMSISFKKKRTIFFQNLGLLPLRQPLLMDPKQPRIQASEDTEGGAPVPPEIQPLGP